METFDLIDRLDAVHDMGRDLLERDQEHGMAVNVNFDRCRFDKWRKAANDALFEADGCNGYYYRYFSREVLDPTIKHLELGLNILARMRDRLSAELPARNAKKPDTSEEKGKHVFG
jgi:hypothetical protein